MKSKPLAQAWIFVLLTFAATSFFHFQFIFRGGIAKHSNLIVWLMWTPGLVGILCSLAFGYRLRDIGFQRLGLKGMAIAFFVPAAAAIVVFTLLLLSGIDTFGIRDKYFERYGDLQGVLFNTFVTAPTVGLALGFLRALGEEIGWRGFLHDKLRRAKVLHPYLWTGLIWSAWHLPPILFADYATSDLPWLSAGLFVIGATSGSIFMGWLRDETGSVWVAAMGHASHNLWMQVIYPRFLKKGPLDQYFGGESGVFLAATYLGLALYLVNFRKKSRSIRYNDSRPSSH